VQGTLGAQHVNLKVSKEGETVKAEGGFGNSPVELRLSPEELHVYVNNCTYRLKAKTAGRAYEGRRSCDRAFIPPSEVTLPDEFLAASPAEQATLLLLSLSPSSQGLFSFGQGQGEALAPPVPSPGGMSPYAGRAPRPPGESRRR
jgi:hypothetical protein